MRNINMDTFALYYKYAYGGNYSVAAMLPFSQSSSQTSPKLKEGNAHVVPTHPRESRTLLHTLLIHVRILLHATINGDRRSYFPSRNSRTLWKGPL
ncbi:hypothetical protein BDV41DRAFT_526912 [Aspergillus transmontanensis]|uniref:Uncharacterized protein n=1 Tax=Aspergillus transmontanensis TaxID=1034304 RepID=A0A5N6W8G0_9EURO|nr:hypothetical protein BDV41DRAFT_526912 [Aspergillus transmontanensis]